MLVCDKRGRAITYVFCRDLQVKGKWSLAKSYLKTKLLSRLSHKVCGLLTSPVLLRKFSLKIRGRRRQVKRRFKSEFAVFQSSSSLFHFACKLCRMYVTSLGVEFLRALSKLRKRKKISSLLVLGAWCYTRRFATTIFTIVSATQGSNVGTTLQPFETTSQQCFNAVPVALKIVVANIPV